MKESNQLIKLIFILFLGITLLTNLSCVREGCTDPLSENFDSRATRDDGTCSFARTKFLGSYNVNENCDSGNWNYAISITESSTGSDAVIINNFGDWSVGVRATISGNNISINDTQEGITFSGSGNINGNTLSIIYTSSGGFTDSCTKSCIKQ